MIINFILSVGLETYQILMSSAQDIHFPALCPILLLLKVTERMREGFRKRGRENRRKKERKKKETLHTAF